MIHGFVAVQLNSFYYFCSPKVKMKNAFKYYKADVIRVDSQTSITTPSGYRIIRVIIQTSVVNVLIYICSETIPLLLINTSKIQAFK